MASSHLQLSKSSSSTDIIATLTESSSEHISKKQKTEKGFVPISTRMVEENLNHKGQTASFLESKKPSLYLANNQQLQLT